MKGTTWFFVMSFLVTVGYAASENGDFVVPMERRGTWRDAGFSRSLAVPLSVTRIHVVDASVGGTGGGLVGAILGAADNAADSGLTMIYLPAGDYRFGTSLVLEHRERLILCGDGAGKTRLLWDFAGKEHQACIDIRGSTTIGIEGVSIERVDSCSFGTNIRLQGYNCRLSGIESIRAASIHVHCFESRGMEINGCSFHHAWNYGTGGHGYGVTLGQGASHTLIENNIFFHLRHSVILSNGPESNVVGYNFSCDPFTTEQYFGISDWPADLCLHGHPDPSLPGPSRNLFEGNVCSFMHADTAWWDNGPYNTFFRNRAFRYGVRIAGMSPDQNVLANEVDDVEGSVPDEAWNALAVSPEHNCVVGNTDFDLHSRRDAPSVEEMHRVFATYNPLTDTVLPENMRAYLSWYVESVYVDISWPSISFKKRGKHRNNADAPCILPDVFCAERSLYLDTKNLPPFVRGLPYFPPVGAVDSLHPGGNPVAAQLRYQSGMNLTVSTRPYVFAPEAGSVRPDNGAGIRAMPVPLPAGRAGRQTGMIPLVLANGRFLGLLPGTRRRNGADPGSGLMPAGFVFDAGVSGRRILVGDDFHR